MRYDTRKMLFFYAFFLTLLISRTFGNKLQIIEAGLQGNYGQILPVFDFCPRAFSPKGFSILCIPSDPSKVDWVVFKVRGHVVHTENKAPFSISGDIGEKIKPWSKYSWATGSDPMYITCQDHKGAIIASAMFSIGCPLPAQAHSRALPPTKNTKNTNAFPSKVQPRSLPPPSPPSISASAPVGVDKKYCVTKKATSMVAGLKPDDWTYVPSSPGALIYKKDVMEPHVVDSPRRAVLKYDLWVPVESHYGIVVELTTRDHTDYNDVWFSCETQRLSLRKLGGTAVRVKGPGEALKVYHNQNGRSKKALTVDFDGHSISTTYKLKPNTKYTCTVGGRSSRTTFHGIIMFPCHEQTCQYASPHWKQYLNICHIN